MTKRTTLLYLNRILAGVVLVLSASELYRIYLGDSESSHLSQLAFLLLVPGLIPYFTIREWAMTGLAILLTLCIWWGGEGEAILHGFDRAAFFAAFIYLVTLLKEAAQRSRSVLELGSYLTRQPQGRRYYSLSVGGHIMGVLLNFGAISLLTPLIQRGARSMGTTIPDEPSSAQLEQQQISALLRGFSWMILWSPTALTQAVLHTSFPDAKASIVIPLGIGASVVMILIGRAMDRIYWRQMARTAAIDPPPFPKHSAGRFGAICVILVVMTFTVFVLADVSAAVALMLVAPILMILWIAAQQVSANRVKATSATLAALNEIFFRSVKAPAQSAYILGVAGYIGVTAAALAPIGQLAEQLNMSAIPAWVFLAALPALITLGGQLALSPILVVVFLASIINELPVLPADPSLIVFALGAGWALSMTASPNASATLLISAITRISPTTLTWRWNGSYAFVCYIAFVIAFVALT